jgi:hypothetical protein
MSYPNSALSAVELSIMAIVVVACMAVWLIAVFLAARDPRRHHAETAALPSAETSVQEIERKPAA